MDNDNGVKFAYCNKCGQETSHRIVLSNTDDWSEVIATYEDIVDITIDGSDVREFLKCCGCQESVFLHTSYFSEHVDFTGRPIPCVRRFPAKQERKFPEWVESGRYVSRDHFLNRLLREVYTSISHDLYGVAAMGVRSVIELMMVERVGDRGAISKNIATFESEGYIGPKQRKVLADTVDFGSAAVHRDFAPSKLEVLLALDIAETIAKQTYVHSEEASELGRRTPKRGSKQKGSAMGT